MDDDSEATVAQGIDLRKPLSLDKPLGPPCLGDVGLGDLVFNCRIKGNYVGSAVCAKNGLWGVLYRTVVWVE